MKKEIRKFAFLLLAMLLLLSACGEKNESKEETGEVKAALSESASAPAGDPEALETEQTALVKLTTEDVIRLSGKAQKLDLNELEDYEYTGDGELRSYPIDEEYELLVRCSADKAFCESAELHDIRLDLSADITKDDVRSFMEDNASLRLMTLEDVYQMGLEESPRTWEEMEGFSYTEHVTDKQYRRDYQINDIYFLALGVNGENCQEKGPAFASLVKKETDESVNIFQVDSTEALKTAFGTVPEAFSAYDEAFFAEKALLCFKYSSTSSDKYGVKYICCEDGRCCLYAAREYNSDIVTALSTPKVAFESVNKIDIENCTSFDAEFINYTFAPPEEG